MAFTYSGNPSASDRDWIRFKLQDTDEKAPLFTDEEIDAQLAESGERLHAAAELAEIAARRFAQQASYSVEGLREDLTARARLYAELAQQLRRQAMGSRTMIVATNRPAPPSFWRGMHENPEVARDCLE